MGLIVIVAAAVAYGGVAGLLLPRAAYRLSVEPGAEWRAHCPEGHPIPAWLGPPRCRGASHRYGIPVAWTAGGCGLVCGGLAGVVGGRPEGAVYVAVAPVLVLLGLVDLAVQRLPDVLTLPLAAATALGLGAAALLPGSGGTWSGALLGGVALGAAYLVLFLINPAGMGLGDVKLALALGVTLGWYGWGVWAVGAFLGFLYGALYGLALVLRGPAGGRTAFAFGPFMAAGALTGVLLGGFGA
ncbi:MULTISPECIES: A24 family peptidase [unclassified Streptomyces]|uniref:A24 family peptidase n=1 Tax=unclassified Streptomyces TaxID=2593676 RepID=UPI002E0E50F2|nr:MULTISPECIES: A24 family peptidase [unclassified Streptomyces]WSR27847.1 A24 family peptidase [Streptomyces sp. NBC_01205]